MKFRQCYTDDTQVTVHSQYVKFKNQMLQCYSVTAHPRAKSQKNMLIIISYYVVLAKCIARYTNVTIVTVRFLYALSTNRMLRCYSVTAHKYTKIVNK